MRLTPSDQAVPAMSRCAHLALSTNSWMNTAPMIVPGLAARADVLDVGDIRLDLLAVFRADRQLPKTFAGFLSAAR